LGLLEGKNLIMTSVVFSLVVLSFTACAVIRYRSKRVKELTRIHAEMVKAKRENKDGKVTPMGSAHSSPKANSSLKDLNSRKPESVQLLPK
jgi:hypothetical protein